MDDSTNKQCDNSSSSLPSEDKKQQHQITYQSRTGKIVEIDPCLIRFSQDTVNNPKKIKDIENGMKNNGWQGDAIDVVRMPDKKLTTVDNRRVLAAKRVGIKVKARIHNYNEPLKNSTDRERFRVKDLQQHSGPDTWGEAARQRVLNQNSFVMRNTEPHGTYTEPYITGPDTSKLVNKHDYDLPENTVEKTKKVTEKKPKRERVKDTATADTKPKADCTSFQENKQITTRVNMKAVKIRLQKRQTLRPFVRDPITLQRSQIRNTWRAHCKRIFPETVSTYRSTEVSQKFKGRIKTTSEYERIVFNSSKTNSIYEKRSHIHENPFYKKKTTTVEGRNHHNPTQNYRTEKTRYSAGRSTKAAAKVGSSTALDTALYAAFATNEGRPSVGEAVTKVATAVGSTLISSVVPGGRLLMTVGTAIASGNYGDIALALPSLIPGNPIHLDHQQTQAHAPLFGSDLLSDDVDRYSAGLGVPGLLDLASVGLCYDREKIEFFRNGVKTHRTATAINAHASFGSTLDASVGFSSGTEISDSVTKKTEDGMTEVTHWEKQFSGQFGARVRVADRKAVWDFGSAFNEETTVTTTKTKSDQTAISVRDSLPLKHLEKVEDHFQRNSETTSHMHNNYVRNESAALPSDGRVEITYAEQTVVKDSEKAYGLWETAHKTEKYDLYIAEENTVHRSDQQLSNEIETTLTHRHVELSGRDLRENSEQTTSAFFSSTNTNEKYESGQKRDKEIVTVDSTDKTKIISKKDGTEYEARQSESKIDKKAITEIEKDYYKKIQHLGSNNEILSTVGQRETITRVRNVEGIFQPEVTTTVHETQQTFERINEHTTYQDPHLEKNLEVKQSYGLLKNKTEVTEKTLTNGEEKTISEVVETLGGATQNALSSLTSNVLYMVCDPAARTMSNVRNAVIDAGMQGVVGWAHSNVAVCENSAGSTAVAAIVSVAANSVTKVCSSNNENRSTKEVLTDVAVSSASPAVSLATSISNNIPIPLKNHAAAITSLVIRTGQTIQSYRENKVNLEEVKNVILQEITSFITNYSIQTYLVPGLVSLLPLGSLAASVVTCIAGTALTFASFKLISWVMNMRHEQLIKREYENLCKDLGVNSMNTDADVNSRYRRLALTVHPDKIGGDAVQFKKLTKDFERLHELRSRYNIQPDKSKTRDILQLLKEFLQDPMSFLQYFSKITTSSAFDDPVVIESPLMITA